MCAEIDDTLRFDADPQNNRQEQQTKSLIPDKVQPTHKKEQPNYTKEYGSLVL